MDFIPKIKGMWAAILGTLEVQVDPCISCGGGRSVRVSSQILLEGKPVEAVQLDVNLRSHRVQ